MPDSVQQKQKRPVKRRSDYGSVQATERDLYVLHWIGQMYAARLDHVQVLGALKAEDKTIQLSGQLGYSAMKNIYRRWLKAGWVEKQKLLVSEPQWLWLSRRGLQAVGLDYAYRSPSLARLRHIHEVNRVRLYIEGVLGDKAEWVSERDINQARKEAGKKHLVDGELLFAGKRIAIEVELNRKSQKRMASILQELRRDYEAVWYFADTACWQTVQTAMSQQSHYQETFVLYNLADVGRSE
ncbi:MAG: hypothetical protein H6658_11450 [Ardenticatenaceae bacterium]|nr:hypothetical protein [Ardenticatenaceae bacterium]